MKREVIVVTAAYGRDRLDAMGGQQAVISVIAAAGADGVEIRRELLSEAALQSLSGLGEAISAAGLIAFYSVPEALFNEQGLLNPSLERHFAEAKQLNAQRVKYSLGSFRRGFDFSPLRYMLASYAVQLVVENDQTQYGRLSTMEAYLEDAGEERADSGLTFDMGNWLWVGDNPIEAAESLSHAVSYIHVKAAVPDGDSWRAVALENADSLWCETLKRLHPTVPRGIEFPLEGDDLVAVTRHYVDLLREE